MALSKATRDLKDVVTCAICVDDFADKDPRTLQCLHAFCARCLDQLHNTKMTGYITCPTCMEQTKLPHGSVYNLRPYFVAKQVNDCRNSSLFQSKYPIKKLCVWKIQKYIYVYLSLTTGLMKQSLHITKKNCW